MRDRWHWLGVIASRRRDWLAARAAKLAARNAMPATGSVLHTAIAVVATCSTAACLA